MKEKRKEKGEESIRICPKCGSTHIKNLHLMSPKENAAFLIKKGTPSFAPRNIEYYGCLSCGHYGVAKN